jgi:hypothetical protein
LRALWDYDGAILLDRGEIEVLITLLFCAASFGDAAKDDLYVVPESAHMLLTVDHHKVVWGEFASGEDCMAYVGALHRHGIELPTEPPDETFKAAPWMRPVEP